MTDFGNIDITAVVPSPQASTSGSSANNPASSTISFSGISSPRSRIIILKDGQIFNTLYASESGAFQVTINNQALGVYNFGLYYEDPSGNLSNITPFQIRIVDQTPVIFRNIILPPTIKISPNQVYVNSQISIEGYTAPNSIVYLSNSQNTNSLISAVSDVNGRYAATYTTTNIGGNFYLRAKTVSSVGYESIFSRNAFFSVFTIDAEIPPLPDKQIPVVFPVCVDSNRNNRVNLVDFSIMLYWYEKPNPPNTVDCNGDKIVNLVDFSVLMYYWTG